MKLLALEEIYADPHKLDPFLESGERVEVVRDGLVVADLVARHQKGGQKSGAVSRPDFKARFLKM